MKYIIVIFILANASFFRFNAFLKDEINTEFHKVHVHNLMILRHTTPVYTLAHHDSQK